jgi:MOSC domain-containing protein YiiM
MSAVAGIFVSGAATVLPVGVDRATVVPGRGLEGDRYFKGEGTFSEDPGTGRALTLVEAEVLDDVGLEWAAARRNVVTRGVGLNDLVGKRFRIGAVECLGQRLCEPCSHLQRLTEDGMLRALAGRGGLRADVLSGGEIAVGDALVELGEG